jgi:Gpi18-like mannosyltransferase
VLHRFTAREFDPATADRALLFLMAFPTAFFLSAGYNGSLFLLLSVSALYLLRGERWWAAGAVGAFASATRLAGVLLAVVFVIEYGRRRAWSLRAVRPDALAILLIPGGLIAFSIFCWIRLGDPLAFTHAQDEWGRATSLPWTGPAHALQTIYQHPLLEQVTVHNLIDVVAGGLALLLLTLCVVGRWRLPRDQTSLVVYAAISLLIVLISPAAGYFPLMGMPRYVLELVPIFLLLARLGANRAFERVYLLPAVGVQAVFLLTFLNNVWVA